MADYWEFATDENHLYPRARAIIRPNIEVGVRWKLLSLYKVPMIFALGLEASTWCLDSSLALTDVNYPALYFM